MLRRALLLLIPLTACAAADPAQEILDRVTGMAASLSAGDVHGFMDAFDPAMPGYGKLRDYITGLAEQGTVESFVDVAEDEGNDRSRKVDLDWRLRIKRERDATAAAPRERRLKCRFEKQGKKWRVTALDPVDFFAP
jgi:hypothetical protein